MNRNPSSMATVDQQLVQQDEQNNDKNLTSSGDVVTTTTTFLPKPAINLTFVQPSRHHQIQHISSQSPKNKSTTQRPTKHPATRKPSSSLPSWPTPQPTRTTRKPTFEPSTLSPISMEPTADPPSMSRPSPSPISFGGPPTVFPFSFRYVEQIIYLLHLLLYYKLLLHWCLPLLLNTSNLLIVLLIRLLCLSLYL